MVTTGTINATAGRCAKKLTEYPSANVGKCWAGQKRLAEQLGCSERTVRYAVTALTRAGLLIVRRGGRGRTSTYAFAIDGQALFSVAETSRHDRQHDRQSEAGFAGVERQSVAGFDRQDFAANLLERHLIERELTPLTPLADAEGGEVFFDYGLKEAEAESVAETTEANREQPACGEAESGHPRGASSEAEHEPPDAPLSKSPIGDLTQDVLPPAELTFPEFWTALVEATGSEGWARTQFRKLGPHERAELRAYLDQYGEIDTGGGYAGNWLRDKGWREPPLPRNGSRSLMAVFRRMTAAGGNVPPWDREGKTEDQWRAEKLHVCRGEYEPNTTLQSRPIGSGSQLSAADIEARDASRRALMMHRADRIAA